MPVGEAGSWIVAAGTGIGAGIAGALGGLRVGGKKGKDIEARLQLIEYKQEEAVKVNDRQNELLDKLFQQSEELAISLAGCKTCHVDKETP